MEQVSSKIIKVEEFCIGDNKTTFYIREEHSVKDSIHKSQSIDWYIVPGDDSKPKYKAEEDTSNILEALYQYELVKPTK